MACRAATTRPPTVWFTFTAAEAGTYAIAADPAEGEGLEVRPTVHVAAYRGGHLASLGLRSRGCESAPAIEEASQGAVVQVQVQDRGNCFDHFVLVISRLDGGPVPSGEPG